MADLGRRPQGQSPLAIGRAAEEGSADSGPAPWLLLPPPLRPSLGKEASARIQERCRARCGPRAPGGFSSWSASFCFTAAQAAAAT